MIDSFSGNHEFLSNFYPSMVMFDGRTYPTVEHAYQAAKTTNLEDRLRIEQASTPGNAKRLGRKVSLRSDWEQIKLTVMRSLLKQKFTDPELREALKNTGTQELVEGNTWNDTFWGVCQGKGQNWLGRLLMEIRQFIQGKSNDHKL